MASIRCYDNSKVIVTIIIMNQFSTLPNTAVVPCRGRYWPWKALSSQRKSQTLLFATASFFPLYLAWVQFLQKMFQCHQRLLFVSASSFPYRQRPITACSIHIMIVQYRTDAWQTWILFVYYTNTMWWMLVLYNDWQEKRDRFTNSLVTLDFSRTFASLGIV